MKFDLNFITDYGQFYINDIKATGDTSSDDFWSNQAFVDKLAVEKEILGISIANDQGIVNCELEILDSKSQISDFSKFDHVVEASIEIKSGILQVIDCPFSEIILESKIENANYRARVYSSNLESAYSEEPKDHYKIEIWKETYSDRDVLKRYFE